MIKMQDSNKEDWNLIITSSITIESDSHPGRRVEVVAWSLRHLTSRSMSLLAGEQEDEHASEHLTSIMVSRSMLARAGPASW